MGTSRLAWSGRAVTASLTALCTALLWGPTPYAAALASDSVRGTASFNDVVRTVFYHGNTIYVGGDFTRATDRGRTVRRSHLAAIDATTGRLLPWRPRTDGPVLALRVRQGFVYVGGDFSSVNGHARDNLARISTGGAVSRGFAHDVNRPVDAVAVDRSSLYIGGKFGAVNGRDRDRLAAFSLDNGRLRTGWTPETSGKVLDLAASRGRVYVAGYFERLNGSSSHGFLGAVSAADGDLVRSFDASIDYRVLDVAVTRSRVYAAADGTGGHLRAFQLDGDNAWDLPTDGGVQAVTVLDGVVYFGGHFDNACRSARSSPGSCRSRTESRRKLAAVNGAGDLLSWNPRADSKLGVVAMDAVRRPERVAVGGAFSHLKRLDQESFAQLG